MKKWLTFLLLLITLAGTLFPCCLTDECNDEEIAKAQKQNKQATEGTCSPFFACATCPGFAHISKPVQIEQPSTPYQVHHESNIVFDLSTYSTSFWQPPRLS